MNNKKLFSGILLAAVAAFSVVVIMRFQNILDYFALRGYTPPVRISQLADATTMNPSTRRVFYINHPELNDKKTFKERCQDRSHVTEQSIVLGCYVSHKGIFLLDVTDPRLNGVIEVTAAHEVLHAAYDRLSSSERERIDGLTADFFSKLQDDRVRKTVEQYRAKDAGVVPTELHSILATEVRDLPRELEQYYSRYFADRKKIVAFSEQYEQTFTSLKNQVAEYDTQLAKLKAQLESNEAHIESLGREVELQRSRLNELLANKQTEEYNAAVPGFNARVNQYNGLIVASRRVIAEYNVLVEKRNDAVLTEQELVQAIDSNSIPSEQ